MTLEEQIKHYRKQAGLSQEKMAEVQSWKRKARIRFGYEP